MVFIFGVVNCFLVMNLVDYHHYGAAAGVAVLGIMYALDAIKDEIRCHR